MNQVSVSDLPLEVQSEAALKNLKNQLQCVSKTYGGSVEFTGEYPAWEYKKDSKTP